MYLRRAFAFGILIASATASADAGKEIQACMALKKGHSAQVEQYSADQLKSVACIASGDLDGPFHSWYADGKKESQGEYMQNVRHGKWTWYYPSGRIKSEGLYQRGVKVCDWREYSEAGAVQATPQAAAEDVDCAKALAGEEELPFVVPAATAASPAPAAATGAGLQGLSWKDIEFGPAAYTQASPGLSLSGAVSYTPRVLHLPSNAILVPRATLLMVRTGSEYTISIGELAIGARWALPAQLYLEPMMGALGIPSPSGWTPAAAPGFALWKEIKLNTTGPLRWMNRIGGRYNLVLAPTLSHFVEVAIGVGL